MQADKSEEKDNSKSETEKSLSDEQNEGNQTSIWEWITAFIGLALVTSAVGFMVYKAIAGSDAPPSVKIQIESIKRVDGEYLVNFRATNEGSVTMADVTIEAETKGGGEKTETKQLTFHYLPSNSIRKGGFFFQTDPRQANLQMRAVSYEQP